MAVQLGTVRCNSSGRIRKRAKKNGQPDSWQEIINMKLGASCCNGVKSDWTPVLSGVPQGTVLGLLLFSLYIIDITSNTESVIRLFADDCVCYRKTEDEEDAVKFQRGLDWVAGQGNGVWDFNLSNATWCSWLENGSRRSMLCIP